MLTRTTPEVPASVLDRLPAACALRKPAVRLHPRRTRGLDAGASKMGGAVAWPIGEAWPRCDAHSLDYVSVAQIRAEDAPSIAFPKDADLVQLLWCPVYDQAHGAMTPIRATTRWRKGAFRSDVRASGEGRLDHDLFVEECALHPEPVLDWPFERPSEVVELLEAHRVTPDSADFIDGWDVNDLYDRIRPASGTKLGGYTARIQDGGHGCCGQDVEAFLTIAAWEFDGGGENAWLPLEERATDDLSLLRAPIGAELNKVGHFYLFICPSCGLEWTHFEN